MHPVSVEVLHKENHEIRCCAGLEAAPGRATLGFFMWLVATNTRD